VQLVPQPILPPLQQQHLVTVQPMQPKQLTQLQAQLKWLLEQVHMVRNRSVNTQPSICKPALDA
jgi:hypothetical protein